MISLKTVTCRCGKTSIVTLENVTMRVTHCPHCGPQDDPPPEPPKLRLVK